MSLVETPDSIFGRIVTGADVEGWVGDLLRKWSSTYIAEVERQHGIVEGTLPRMRSWVVTPTFDKWPEDQLPGLLLISPGTAERPLRDGDGRYRVRWQIMIGCIASARTQAEAHFLVMSYIAAHSKILDDRPSLEGKASGVVWQGERYGEIEYDDLRSIWGAISTYTVEVENVRTAPAGPITPDEPLDPDTLPWPPWATVETVGFVYQHFPPPDPLPEGDADASRS